MAGVDDLDRIAMLQEIGAEIHCFVQANPNHYAARALANLVNRIAAGDTVGDDERELVLLTLAREAKSRARAQPFGR